VLSQVFQVSSPRTVTASIISHGHANLVEHLLASLVHFPDAWHVQCVVLTVNLHTLHEREKVERLRTSSKWPFTLDVIENANPKGFGANHNAAFLRCETDYFAVINPDIVFTEGAPDTSTTVALKECAGCFYPMQVTMDGQRLDSERELVTPCSVFVRQVLRIQRVCATPDWVNGACMVFRSDVYRSLNGFDERYFMYCEDVDICLRLQTQGFALQALPYRVIHDTRRNTLKSGQHFRWHLRSLFRLWLSKAFWQYWWMRRTVRHRG
jgi:N-acetylglucosaminyl-diphospho-decaprenol L-rhamnosyltransferase